MKIFQTPRGKAGCDQIDSMVESVHSEIEQMFHQLAKRRALEYGVGKTTARLSGADSRIALDAQKRECDAQMVSHAGRALELALHVIYARGVDRIMGRDYPGVPEYELDKHRRNLEKDRKTHNLRKLYGRILRELGNDEIKSGLEDVYQRALHTGITSFYVDGKLVGSVFLPGNVPFKEVVRRSLMDGAEMTLDHSSVGDMMGAMLGLGGGHSEFSRMPDDTFELFLTKADAVYYGSDTDGTRRNMHWAKYSARDHEYGRPYVVIGTEFFARLVRGVVEFSEENQATWHEDFVTRWHERRQHNIKKIMEAHARELYDETIELPEMVSIDRTMNLFRLPLPQKPATYDSLHARYNFD